MNMKILEHKEDCCGCSACYNSCPVSAIEMKYNQEGFWYPIINDELCIHCNKCRRACPVLKPIKKNRDKKVYLAYAKSYAERMTSSSGGVFAVLANAVLVSGGIVCGACFNPDMEVEHIIISNQENLNKLKGTKYVQSDINNVFQQIEVALKKDKKVLFSGTPCQVAGLKTFLGQDYTKLICVDLICHGVPSPKVWKDYMANISPDKKISYVNFREKNTESKTTQIVYYMNDNTSVTEEKNESLYMKGFIQNLYVRPSCFQCKFKGNNRLSDITIGDFWSAQEFHADIADEYGNSVLIARTERGQELLEQSKLELVIKKATIKEAATWNECLLESTKYNEKRQDFYRRWRSEPLQSILKDLTKTQVNMDLKEEKLISKFKRMIKNIIK